jgi:hypothetical protein
MLKRSAWAGSVLLTLMLLEGGIAVAHANAQWGLSFEDPARFDLRDVSGAIDTAATYRDWMEDVRQALRLAPQPTCQAFVAVDTATEVSPGAEGPRAPPAA